MTNLCTQPYCQSLDLIVMGSVLAVLFVACGICMWRDKG